MLVLNVYSSIINSWRNIHRLQTTIFLFASSDHKRKFKNNKFVYISTVQFLFVRISWSKLILVTQQ